METSSNQRSASEGVRLWEGTTGEDGGGTTIAGAAEDQLLPVESRRSASRRPWRPWNWLQRRSPGCAEVGATTGVLTQGLVSRAGSGGGRTGGAAVAGTEKVGAVPFTAASERQKWFK